MGSVGPEFESRRSHYNLARIPIPGELIQRSSRDVSALTDSRRRQFFTWKAKQRALAHPDMTEELAEVLSTSVMQLSDETRTDIDTS